MAFTWLSVSIWRPCSCNTRRMAASSRAMVTNATVSVTMHTISRALTTIAPFLPGIAGDLPGIVPDCLVTQRSRLTLSADLGHTRTAIGLPGREVSPVGCRVRGDHGPGRGQDARSTGPPADGRGAGGAGDRVRGRDRCLGLPGRPVRSATGPDRAGRRAGRLRGTHDRPRPAVLAGRAGQDRSTYPNRARCPAGDATSAPVGSATSAGHLPPRSAPAGRRDGSGRRA